MARLVCRASYIVFLKIWVRRRNRTMIRMDEFRSFNWGAHPFSLLGNLRKSLKAAGFHCTRIPSPDRRMDQFAHASVIVFATSDGRMSEYQTGVDCPVREVRLALVNGSHVKIAFARDLYCCDYVPSSRKYTVANLRWLGF